MQPESVDFRNVAGLFTLCPCGRPDEQVYISGEHLGMSPEIAYPMERVEGGFRAQRGEVQTPILTPGTPVFPLCQN